VNQFLEEFPETPKLHSVESYDCTDFPGDTCGRARRREGGFCRGCECASDIRTSQWGSGSGVYNYWTYMSRRIYRPTLVVDEAHGITSLIRELESDRIWQHDARYPNSVVPSRPETIREWLESLPPKKLQGKKLGRLYHTVTSEAPQYIVERTLELYNGKGTKRGKPEERDCIRMLPIDIRDARPYLWPQREVRKIILLSATISSVDIADLGLDRRRVCYLECVSPIPAERRPVIRDYVATVSGRWGLEDATRKIAAHIEEVYLPHHVGQKGLIHATYSQARMLRDFLTSDRFIFHDANSKRDQYEYFRSLPPDSGAVLVASGMYEGVDLPYDAARWQVVAKIPWSSLGDAAIRHQAEVRPEWYTWITLRTVIQACGRVCRAPDDEGITYMVDRSYERLYSDASRFGIIPTWFADANGEHETLPEGG
jgi:Rad3-related DNA helicase